MEFNINWFHTLTSTNDVCIEKGRSGCPEGSVVAAMFQENGRGQRGNVWNGEAGKNLLFSILLRPTFLRVDEQFLLSKVTAIALCEFISICGTGATVSIKWPNDIYIGNRKVAGVLIENSFSSAQLDSSVVGIGINLNQTDFPANLPNPTSLALQAGRQFNLDEALAQFLEHYKKWYVALKQGEHELIGGKYMHLLYRRDVFGRYSSGGNEFTARIAGISPIGELILETEQGEQRVFAHKEVAFVL